MPPIVMAHEQKLRCSASGAHKAFMDAPGLDTAQAMYEIIDNAIQAGATRINIKVRLDDGALEVSDNGQGMDLETLQNAVTMFATIDRNAAPDKWLVTRQGAKNNQKLWYTHTLARIIPVSGSKFTDRDALRFDVVTTMLAYCDG
eukprot:SAG31_NODE_15072_length_772_cov_1.002972_1_plen_145_part_00